MRTFESLPIPPHTATGQQGFHHHEDTAAAVSAILVLAPQDGTNEMEVGAELINRATETETRIGKTKATPFKKRAISTVAPPPSLAAQTFRRCNYREKVRNPPIRQMKRVRTRWTLSSGRDLIIKLKLKFHLMRPTDEKKQMFHHKQTSTRTKTERKAQWIIAESTFPTNKVIGWVLPPSGSCSADRSACACACVWYLMQL